MFRDIFKVKRKELNSDLSQKGRMAGHFRVKSLLGRIAIR